MLIHPSYRMAYSSFPEKNNNWITDATFLWPALPIWSLPLPPPMPSSPTSVTCAPTMPDCPILESLPRSSTQTLPSPTPNPTNKEDLSSTSGSTEGTLLSPIFSPANDEDPSFKELDDDDSDQSVPLPLVYDGGDDTKGGHVMTGGRASQVNATWTSSQIKKNRLEKLKAARAKLASLEPAVWKKGKEWKKGKMIKSKNVGQNWWEGQRGSQGRWQETLALQAW